MRDSWNYAKRVPVHSPGCATGTWPRRRGNANDNSTRGLNNSPLFFPLCPLDSCENVRRTMCVCMRVCMCTCPMILWFKEVGCPLALEEDRGSSSLKKSSFVGENVEMKVSVMKVCSKGMQGIGIFLLLILWFLSDWEGSWIFCNRFLDRYAVFLRSKSLWG